jgi:hypothetical protein
MLIYASVRHPFVNDPDIKIKKTFVMLVKMN